MDFSFYFCENKSKMELLLPDVEKIEPEKYGFGLVREYRGIKTYLYTEPRGTDIEIKQHEDTFTIRYRLLDMDWNILAFRYKCENKRQFSFLLFNSGISHLLNISDNHI